MVKELMAQSRSAGFLPRRAVGEDDDLHHFRLAAGRQAGVAVTQPADYTAAGRPPLLMPRNLPQTNPARFRTTACGGQYATSHRG